LIASFVAALGAIVFKKTVLWLLISLLPFYLKGKKILNQLLSFIFSLSNIIKDLNS
jgi:hypothetical protein